MSSFKSDLINYDLSGKGNYNVNFLVIDATNRSKILFDVNLNLFYFSQKLPLNLKKILCVHLIYGFSFDYGKLTPEHLF